MLLDAISKAGTIALGGHVRPDGDCAGSCMGLYNYVRENFPEKEIDVYLEELPNTLKFMKNTDKIRHEVTEEKTYDLFIALDCGDMGRLGFSAVLFKKAAVRFCVDHHVSNQSFADQNALAQSQAVRLEDDGEFRLCLQILDGLVRIVKILIGRCGDIVFFHQIL